jgi:hypothetical protein
LAELSLPRDIPGPETFARRHLAKAPSWLRRIVLNALAIFGWIGLPGTVVSALADMRFSLDAALWLYLHAGLVKPTVAAVGQGIAFVVAAWRAVTHPIWHALFEWLHIALPTWAPDVLTLLALLGAGYLRRQLRVLWGARLSGALMHRGAKPGRAPPTEYISIPRRFPYAAHFTENDIRLTPARLADAQRLWRKWRTEQIWAALYLDPRRWPRFREGVIRAQFGRYWLAVTDGRRDFALYAAIAVCVLLAMAADFAYVHLLPK